MPYESVVIVVVVVMLVGLVGTLLPGIPGIPLIWLALAGFIVVDRFQHLSFLRFLLFTVIAIIGSGAEMWSTQALTRVSGGSGWSAMAGTCLTVIGLIVFTLPTALLLALAGVFGLEWRRRKHAGRAAVSSVGWLIGWALSVVLEFSTAVVLILLFVQTVAT